MRLLYLQDMVAGCIRRPRVRTRDCGARLFEMLSYVTRDRRAAGGACVGQNAKIRKCALAPSRFMYAYSCIFVVCGAWRSRDEQGDPARPRRTGARPELGSGRPLDGSGPIV